MLLLAVWWFSFAIQIKAYAWPSSCGSKSTNEIILLIYFIRSLSTFSKTFSYFRTYGYYIPCSVYTHMYTPWRSSLLQSSSSSHPPVLLLLLFVLFFSRQSVPHVLYYSSIEDYYRRRKVNSTQMGISLNKQEDYMYGSTVHMLNLTWLPKVILARWIFFLWLRGSEDCIEYKLNSLILYAPYRSPLWSTTLVSSTAVVENSPKLFFFRFRLNTSELGNT